jgi:hypothetical protein
LICGQEKAEFVAPWVAWHVVLFFLQVIVAAWCGDIVGNYMESHAIELGSVIITVIISEGEWLLPGSINKYVLHVQKAVFRKAVESVHKISDSDSFVKYQYVLTAVNP